MNRSRMILLQLTRCNQLEMTRTGICESRVIRSRSLAIHFHGDL